jgi:hypothetical protein
MKTGPAKTRVYGHGRKCECEECRERAFWGCKLDPEREIAKIAPVQLGCRVIMAGGKLVYRKVEAPLLRLEGDQPQ